MRTVFDEKSMKEKLRRLEYIMEHETAHKVSATLIIINAIVLGLKTSAGLMSSYSDALNFIDKSMCAVFTVEVLLRIFGSNTKFFKNGWNVFDFSIMATSLISFSSGITAVRVLRVFRIAEVLSISKYMRLIVSSLAAALPGIMHVAVMLMLLFYVSAIAAFDLFSKSNPDLFGSLGGSVYTLFIMMLGDGVGDTISAVAKSHPCAYIFFVIFLSVMTFTMLNLFFGLIVDAIQRAAENDRSDNLDDESAADKRLKSIENDLKEIMLAIKATKKDDGKRKQ
jgi:voltage-gated sodium channel